MTATRPRNKAREFFDGLLAIARHPDGERRLRFIGELMKSPALLPKEPDEIWKRYEDFCRKEVAECPNT